MMLRFFNVLALFLFINLSDSQTSKCQNRVGGAAADWAIVYKAPGQANGKIIEATSAGAWQDGAQALSNDNAHSFAKTLEHVVGNDNNIKFLAYNNAPPGVPNINTKSNSKGVIILATNADAAAWIVHTVPGFPTAKTAYSWPVAENARGHLLICLTISESQINAIEGKIPTLPPFTSRQTIRTQDAASPVTVHIYSKSESSKYGDCRGLQRHIRLIKSPAVVVDHNTNLEADITNWAVSDPGNIFCHIDKPYFNRAGGAAADWAIVYKAPGQANGKIIEATAAGAWQNGAAAIANNAGHSFAKALEHVVANHVNVKFLAYNNAPPGVPSIKTKSSSKGVIILSNAADSAAWIVHTVPGFPTAKTAYTWPVAENVRGHLLICLTISESQINAIEGKIPTLPPFTSRQTIRTQDAGSPVTVHIYSKSESSKYGDCRGLQRHIRLIKSPAVVVDHNTNLEADITNWAVSDPGNIFCHIDKPYFNKAGTGNVDWAIVYKAPGQANGKIIFATAAGAWDNGAQPFTNAAGHSFAKALEHVVGNNGNIKFLAYNNAPPGVPNLKTKSNSKGIIILSDAADSAAWIVHTVPGFPTAKTAYTWPVAENARGHLLICLTISESQINAIEGKIPTLPPFTSRQTIRTQDAGSPVTVHIYSKSESSKYGEHELSFNCSFRRL
ncbi:Deoxyribonuclease-2-alpha [Trichinella papuae]|uniref:Deoxyribonuclease-2-alpha n=1 Tax=Trichinella papuae TaxID=268474 RepID=A0A0V1M2P4_9BILA|nr:Deoxyribonuclease-2-alpha [Trichinella papuae]